MFPRPAHELKNFWVMSLPAIAALLFSRVAFSSQISGNSFDIAELGANANAPMLMAPQIRSLPQGVQDSRLMTDSEQAVVTQSLGELQYGGRSLNAAQYYESQMPYSVPVIAHPYFTQYSSAVVTMDLQKMFPNVPPAVNAFSLAPEAQPGFYFPGIQNEKEASDDEEDLSEAGSMS